MSSVGNFRLLDRWTNVNSGNSFFAIQLTRENLPKIIDVFGDMIVNDVVNTEDTLTAHVAVTGPAFTPSGSISDRGDVKITEGDWITVSNAFNVSVADKLPESAILETDYLERIGYAMYRQDRWMVQVDRQEESGVQMTEEQYTQFFDNVDAEWPQHQTVYHTRARVAMVTMNSMRRNYKRIEVPEPALTEQAAWLTWYRCTTGCSIQQAREEHNRRSTSGPEPDLESRATWILWYRRSTGRNIQQAKVAHAERMLNIAES